MKISTRPLTTTDVLLVIATLACVGFALLLIALYGRNIPLAEDWTMVPALTGNEPHFWQWLWSQNNEHRVPLPRALYLILLTITGGDFRVGMVFNVFLLGILALAMLWTSRYLRGGQSKLVDLFFPSFFCISVMTPTYFGDGNFPLSYQ